MLTAHLRANVQLYALGPPRSMHRNGVHTCVELRSLAISQLGAHMYMSHMCKQLAGLNSCSLPFQHAAP